jgi:threonyl-tRNA synthetase
MPKFAILPIRRSPYVLIFGDKEAESHAVSVRTRGKGDQGSVGVTDFVAKCQQLISSKSTDL